MNTDSKPLNTPPSIGKNKSSFHLLTIAHRLFYPVVVVFSLTVMGIMLFFSYISSFVMRFIKEKPIEKEEGSINVNDFFNFKNTRFELDYHAACPKSKDFIFTMITDTEIPQLKGRYFAEDYKIQGDNLSLTELKISDNKEIIERNTKTLRYAGGKWMMT